MMRSLRWGVAAALLVATACGGGTVESAVPESSVPIVAPATAVFTATGSSSAASFTATESGFKSSPRARPASLTFTATGAANAQHFIVSEAGYDGMLTQRNGCRNAARVSPSRSRGPRARFTVKPVRLVGACIVTVTDAAGRAATVLVSVLPSPPSPLEVSPASLAFQGVGAAQAASISVSEQNYAGNFTASSTTCSGIASLGSTTLRPSDATGIATDLITPVAVGSCSISVSDSNGQNVTIPVTVTTTSIGVH
jgi:hypothetical protein